MIRLLPRENCAKNKGNNRKSFLKSQKVFNSTFLNFWSIYDNGASKLINVQNYKQQLICLEKNKNIFTLSSMEYKIFINFGRVFSIK